MQIFTSYFAKQNKLPANAVVVSICAKAPQFYNGLQYKTLAPSYDCLMTYKKNYDKDMYTQTYNKEVLQKLTAQEVINDLKQLTNDADTVVLLCYEKPTDFCHRHIVADWLNKNGIDCKEWTQW